MKKTKFYKLLTGAFVSMLFTNAIAQTDITNLAGTVSAQYTDSPTNEDIGKVVDNLSSTKYLTFHNSGWIQFQSASSYVVTRYSITSANDADARDPKDWTLQGSSNGTTWTTLDTRVNEDFATRFLRREFTVSTTVAYSYYRLQMTNNSGTILQLAEWEIFGQQPNVTTVYKHCSYSTTGYAVALPAGDYTQTQLVAKGIANNDVSSLRVTSGYEVVLYDLDNFQGTTITVSADISCLTSRSFNDRTSSMRVRAVSTNQSPSVNITSPVNNASYTSPATISVAANASDNDGSITKVEFFNGSTKLGEDLSSPYTYSWSGVAAGTYTLTARATDNGGLTTTSSGVTVQVTTPAGDWANFPYPTINFVNNAPTHQGSQIFNTAIPDPVAAMRAQILDVCKKLHYNVNDNIRTFSKLNFYLEDYDGVAAKWGAPPEISIQVSVRHLVNVYNNTGGDYNAIRTEILGILSHEGTHGYQYEPKNAGAYDGNSDFYGFIEGLADYVRISVGLHPGRNASTGGSWRHGYTTSGFFIKWMVDKKDPNFAIKFQHTARTYSTWSWNAACTEILGTGVQPLWDEYQSWISAGQPIAPLRMGDIYVNSEMEKYTCVHNHKEDSHSSVDDAATGFSNLSGNTLNIISKDGSEIRSVELHGISTGISKKVSCEGVSIAIDVSNLPDGLYILLVHHDKGVRNEKVLIQR